MCDGLICRVPARGDDLWRVGSQELVLQCCPAEHLGGLLPWHCRVTQYAHLGPLRSVSERRARHAFVEYAGVQQRYGK